MKSNFKKVKEKRANALIIVLGILFVLSSTAVSFSKLSLGGKLAMDNQSNMLRARAASKAGLQEAIVKLRRDYRDKLFSSLKNFVTLDNNNVTNSTSFANNWAYSMSETTVANAVGEDQIAAGLTLEEMARLQDVRLLPHPSYGEIVETVTDNGVDKVKMISGSLDEDKKQVYLLKIFDTTSQLNINSQLVPGNEAFDSITMDEMIDNLSQAIAAREPYRSKFTDSNGPFYDDSGNSLAKTILLMRDKFGSKFDLVNVPNINTEKLKYGYDFICVTDNNMRPTVARNEKMARSLGTDFNEQYRPDTRAPVNVNTASWPVLVSVMQGLTAIIPDTGASVSISQRDAQEVADFLCAKRREFPFVGWEGVERFREVLTNELKDPSSTIFTGISDSELRTQKLEIILANANPNVSLRRLNPDKPAWQAINKTDLTYYTTEFCFYPLGEFEITSLGQIYGSDGKVQNQAKTHAIANVFKVQYKNSQQDFQETQLTDDSLGATALDQKADRNAFSYVNNIQKEGAVVNPFFGYIQPVIYDIKYDSTDLNNIVNLTTDNATAGVSFRVNFNSGLDADEASVKVLQTPTPLDLSSGMSLKRDDIPAGGIDSGTHNTIGLDTDSIAFGEFMVDGVLFLENEGTTTTHRSTLCYQANGNLPSGDIGEENGAVMFWFKLNENVDWADMRTVFFSTSVIKPSAAGDADLGIDPEMESGIQMEIQMQYNEATQVLDVQARRRYYGVPEEVSFNFEESRARYSYESVREHEWYMLTVRWRDGVDLDLGSTADSIFLFGNQYNAPDDDAPAASGYFDSDSSFATKGNYILPDGSSTSTMTVAKTATPAVDPDNPPATPFVIEPLIPQETETAGSGLNGRFYVGAAPQYTTSTNNVSRVFSSSMTIDDISIVREANNSLNATTNLFLPTRFTACDEEQTFAGAGKVFISVFNGGFSGVESGYVHKSVMDWTVLVPSGAEEPEALVFDDDATSSTSVKMTESISLDLDAQQLRPQLAKKIHGVKEKMWRRIFRFFNNIPNSLNSDQRKEAKEFAKEYGKEIKDLWNDNRHDYNNSVSPFRRVSRLQNMFLFGTFNNTRRYVDDIRADIQALITVEENNDPGLDGGDGGNGDGGNGDNSGDGGNGGGDGGDGSDGGGEEVVVEGPEGEDEAQPQIDSSKTTPLSNPGLPINDGEGISFLPPYVSLEYQLRFQQTTQGIDADRDGSIEASEQGLLVPQYLTPMVDDLTFVYQSVTEYSFGPVFIPTND